MNFQLKMLRIASVALAIAILCFVATCSAKAAKQDCRERAIRDTLTMTLVVGMEMREQGKKPTWLEIQSEVERRLKGPANEYKALNRPVSYLDPPEQ